MQEKINQSQNPNSKKLWFVNKTYGWGWTPASWQGWVVTFVFVVLVALVASRVDDNASGREVFVRFIIPTFALVIALYLVACRTGEKPRWQWGKKKEK